jgi:SAM-dependent methyltransferase/DNA-binding transcriptional ArsR family regulator
VSELANGFMASRMLQVAAKLGIADFLGDGAAAGDEIARATGSHPSALARLLRGLGELGLVSEQRDGRFRLTAAGRRLRRDHRDSVASLALAGGAPHVQAAWAELAHAVRTGRSAFYYALGAEYWAYAARHPDLAPDESDGPSSEERVVLDACDFSGISTLVDVGGGRGRLLAAILGQNPEMKAIVFDLPTMAPAAEVLLAEVGIGGRASFVGGDFFSAVPSGGGVYLLANVVRDWSDADSVRILESCRRAMAPGARLLLLDRSGGDVPALENLHRMVLFGGAHERTTEELAGLLEAAGFEKGRVVATAAHTSLLEALQASIAARDRPAREGEGRAASGPIA